MATSFEADGIASDLPLIESGVLDSLGIYSLVVYIEQTFGVSVGDAELHPDNFRTLKAISQFVAGKSATPGG